MTLRQAEEAIRSERYEEALQLASRPEVAQHRKALKLRDRIAERLVKRAQEHLRFGHSQAAWQDLRKAERAGARPALLESLRGALLEHALEEIGAYLDAGNPRHAFELAERVTRQGMDSSRLRRLRGAAEFWARGETQRRAGRFSEAAETLETAHRHLGAHPVLEQQMKGIQGVQKEAAALRSQLQAAVAAENWQEVLRVAGLLLELAPDCPEARSATQEAWRRMGVPVNAASAAPETMYTALRPAATTSESTGGLMGRFILWIDGVGGYLVCTGKSVKVGQAAPGGSVDIGIFGDLSHLHATFVRDSEGYLVQGRREIYINGHRTPQGLLSDGDVIRLGRSVELQFATPSPISATARLTLLRPHRLHLSLSGILLMAETCIIGPSTHAHVRVPHASGEVVIYRQGETLWCRAESLLEIDDQVHSDRAPLRWSSRVSVGEMSFSLEPLNSPLHQV